MAEHPPADPLERRLRDLGAGVDALPVAVPVVTARARRRRDRRRAGTALSVVLLVLAAVVVARLGPGRTGGVGTGPPPATEAPLPVDRTIAAGDVRLEHFAIPGVFCGRLHAFGEVSEGCLTNPGSGLWTVGPHHYVMQADDERVSITPVDAWSVDRLPPCQTPEIGDALKRWDPGRGTVFHAYECDDDVLVAFLGMTPREAARGDRSLPEFRVLLVRRDGRWEVAGPLTPGMAECDGLAPAPRERCRGAGRLPPGTR